MITAIQTQSSAASAGTAAPTAFAGGSDFTMFLKMLTTQMQNQNPLNPVEAADFAVQLATFSGVEHQVQTNQLLARMTEGIMSADLAGWLDTDVAAGSTAVVDKGDVLLHLPAPVAGAARRDVVLSTMSGQEVLRLAVGLDQTEVRIDPSSGGATPLLPGRYQASLQDFAGADVIDTQVAPQFLPVREVRKGAAGTVLLLSSGALVDPSDVTAIRKP